MNLGVAINDTWSFFNEIYEYFQDKHQTSLFIPEIKHLPIFRERFDRYQYRNQLNQFLSKNDVVFFEWSGELLAHATALPKQSGIVTRLHRYELYQWAKHIAWNKVDQLILVSQEKEHEILKIVPDLKGRTIVIPEAVSLKKFKFNPQPFRRHLGILCHLSPRKRVYELILAFADENLAKEGFKLYIGGGLHPKFPDYFYATHNLVENLGLQESVIFHDHVEDPEIWYQNIDIFLSNSYSEGLQVSPLEAMASGCYCLSHHWGGADELLPTENIFLTNSEMAEKIRHYSNLNEDDRKKHRLALRNRVEERFDIEKTKISILKVIESVVQGS
jgi:glycosyltransferase involved in cell wall biosynthesis